MLLLSLILRNIESLEVGVEVVTRTLRLAVQMAFSPAERKALCRALWGRALTGCRLGLRILVPDVAATSAVKPPSPVKIKSGTAIEVFLDIDRHLSLFNMSPFNLIAPWLSPNQMTDQHELSPATI